MFGLPLDGILYVLACVVWALCYHAREGQYLGSAVEKTRNWIESILAGAVAYILLTGPVKILGVMAVLLMFLWSCLGVSRLAFTRKLSVLDRAEYALFVPAFVFALPALVVRVMNGAWLEGTIQRPGGILEWFVIVGCIITALIALGTFYEDTGYFWFSRAFAKEMYVITVASGLAAAAIIVALLTGQPAPVLAGLVVAFRHGSMIMNSDSIAFGAGWWESAIGHGILIVAGLLAVFRTMMHQAGI